MARGGRLPEGRLTLAGVTAWIVAVEHHTPSNGAPSPLDFRSPVANRALEWAEWLKDQPNARLVLNIACTPGSTNAQRLEALRSVAVNAKQADRADSASLHNSVRIIKNTPAQDTLLLLWIGHGILSNSERFLLHQESIDQQNLRSWEVASVLQHLRSTPAPGAQIGIFDTCAQVIDVTPANERLGGTGDAVLKQHYFFSATAGAIASLSKDKDTLASFGLDVLKKTAWPPQPEAFQDELVARMHALPSMPIAWEWTAGSGDLWSRRGRHADSAAHAQAELNRHAERSNIGEAFFLHLWRELEGTSISAPQLAQALRVDDIDSVIVGLRAAGMRIQAIALERAWARVQLVHKWVKPLAGLELLLEKWIDLARRVGDEDGRSVPPFSELRELLLWTVDMGNGVGENAQRTARALVRLILLARGESASSFSSPQRARTALEALLEADPVLGPLRASVAADLPDLESAIVLLVELDLAERAKEPHINRCWLVREGKIYPGPEVVRRPRMGDSLNEVVDGVMSGHGGPLRVELLAPFSLLSGRREWVSYCVDNASEAVQGNTLGVDTMVPVYWRWRERMAKADLRFKAGVWEKDAKTIRERVRERDTLRCHFNDESGKAVVVASAEADVLGLVYLPPGPGEAGARRVEFLNALTLGHPYMIWPSSKPADLGELKTAIRTMLANARIDTLPEGYREACRFRTVPDITLFLDEPERNPYSQKNCHLKPVGSFDA